jgi:hypothetical protein
MNREAKIVYSLSAAVVVGLGLLAAPAIAGIADEASAVAANHAPASTEAPLPVKPTLTEEPAAEPASLHADSVERNPDDWLNRPKSTLCNRYTDHGINDYATGDVVETKGDLVMFYQVAEGDTLIGIMERFCTPSSAHIFYANNMQYDDTWWLDPGEVITIRPY